MPTDKLIEERIREKNENMKSKEMSEENDKSTNKMSLSSNMKQSLGRAAGKKHGGCSQNDYGGIRMRKQDRKLYNSFLEMLMEYDYNEGKIILEHLTHQFREEYYDEDDEDVDKDDLEMEDDEDENEMNQSDD